MVQILAPISAGELIDKITILRIKREEIIGAVAQGNVERELHQLLQIRAGARFGTSAIAPLEEELFRTNRQLWDVENELRALEQDHNFGASFVELARSVYRLNDRRNSLKKQVNELTGSAIVEEKSYPAYD
jgi:uncharacterized protein DUF6165